MSKPLEPSDKTQLGAQENSAARQRLADEVWHPDPNLSSAVPWEKQAANLSSKPIIGGTYTVQFGDSMYGIAERTLQGQGNPTPTAPEITQEESYLVKLNDKNYQTLDSNPDLIHGGWKLDTNVKPDIQKNKDGQITSIRYPNGKIEDYSYDSKGGLSQIVEKYQGSTYTQLKQGNTWGSLSSQGDFVTDANVQDVRIDAQGNQIFDLKHAGSTGAPTQETYFPEYGDTSWKNLSTDTITNFHASTPRNPRSWEEIEYKDGSTRTFLTDDQGLLSLMVFKPAGSANSQTTPLDVSREYGAQADSSCIYMYTDSQGKTVEVNIDPQGKTVYEGPVLNNPFYPPDPPTQPKAPSKTNRD